MQLEDLDFSDKLALLSHTQQQMQMKTVNKEAVSTATGPNVHKGRSKYNTENIKQITFDE